jgi:signal transduction histidine kinase
VLFTIIIIMQNMFMSIRYCYSILLIGCFISVEVLAQTSPQLSELKKDLQKAQDLLANNPEQSLKWAKNLEAPALKTNDLNFMAQVYTTLGNIYGLKQDRSDKAAEYHRKAFQIYHNLFQQKQVSGAFLYAFFSDNITPIYELISDENYNRRRRDKLAIRKYQELYTELSRFFLQNDVKKALQNTPPITKQVVVNFTQPTQTNSLLQANKVEIYKVLHHQQKELYEAYIKQLEGVLQKSKIDIKTINEAFAQKRQLIENQLDTFNLLIVGKDSLLAQNNLIAQQKLNLEKNKSQVKEANYKAQLANNQRFASILVSLAVLLLCLVLGVYWSNWRVKKRKKLIEQQNEELKTVNYELDQFSYRVSHDIRAPIASTLGLVNLAQDETNLSQIAQYLKLMEKSLKKLDQFIKDVLSHSKSTRGKSQIENIDLAKLIDEVLLPFRHNPELAKIAIQVNVEEADNQAFYSDKYLLEVILNNLIGNAIRYSDTYKPNSFLEINAKFTSQLLVLQIQDNGIGIAEEHLPHIFEMFYRANSNTSGSGLGLYMVKQNVAKLNGNIKVRAKVDEGTHFEIEIPNITPSPSLNPRQFQPVQSPQILEFVS